jgi:hypothetical protein
MVALIQQVLDTLELKASTCAAAASSRCVDPQRFPVCPRCKELAAMLWE